MKVVSLFDGISCARVALKRARLRVDEYHASEIDPYAIKIALKNFPNTKHIGDVKSISKFSHPHLFDKSVDLLIGGSPCQDLSIANNTRKGLKGSRSGLFWEYARILKAMKPKYFILENVASMPKEVKDIITKELGVEPILIDAALVSAQRRKRLFWTNIPNVQLPKDKGIFLRDVLLDENTFDTDTRYQYRRYYFRKTNGGKVPTLTANMGTGGHNVPFVRVKEATVKGYTEIRIGEVDDLSYPNSPTRRGRRMVEKSNALVTTDCAFYKLTEQGLRKLLPVECERLQCLPDGYTEGVSASQQYKAVGNGFNVEVVRHILKHI